jgi:twitching motility protein PilT
VLGSLHTQSAIATVDRILDAFPSDQQNQVRSQLSESLKGIVRSASSSAPTGAGASPRSRSCSARRASRT